MSPVSDRPSLYYVYNVHGLNRRLLIGLCENVKIFINIIFC